MLRLYFSKSKIRQIINEKINFFNKNISRQYSNEKYNQKCPDKFIKKCTSENFVDGNNVFRSCHEHFDNFKGLYLHEIIWKDVNKWWNKTALVKYFLKKFILIL